MPKQSAGGKVHQADIVLGSRGGKKGGPARAKALSPAKRTAIAKQGGKARQKQKRTGH